MKKRKRGKKKKKKKKEKGNDKRGISDKYSPIFPQNQGIYEYIWIYTVKIKREIMTFSSLAALALSLPFACPTM